ncbi:MFS transporter [Proteiniclasticum sp. BAD-10]|uniref:MFS transporter n=1 Tax=Proteiniclasticum sediminis TaxID=2804028 RepID=A0A941CPE9_9CLOT|nr:MFS transporter [Proteiniclasticum sediminis]MBR0575807.1 MFS transporter [Proteiniclasticum sediminis]
MRRKLESLLFGNSKNIKYYAMNGILFTMVSVLSRSYAIKFLDRVGGTELHFSLFNALPGFVAIFTTIPGILLIQRGKSKRKMLGLFFYLSRSLPLLLAAVPFLPKSVQPLVFVMIYGLMNFPESISVTALQDYTGDVFSPSERGDAISVRNQLSQISQISVSILVGFILSLSTDNGTLILLYQGFLVLSFLIGLKEIQYMYKMEPRNIPSAKADLTGALSERLLTPFKTPAFRNFLICSLLFHFGWQMGWPLYSIYQIRNLGANELWLTIINAVSSFFMVITFGLWSRMVKKMGYGFATTLATFGMAATPILYVLSKNLPILTFMQIFTGFFTSGTTIAILGYLLDVVPDNNRTLSVAIHATLTSITLAVAPLVGNAVLTRYGIEAALILTGILRFVGSAAFGLRYLQGRRR